MKVRLEDAQGMPVAERDLPDGPIPEVLILTGNPERVFKQFRFSGDMAVFRQCLAWRLKGRKGDAPGRKAAM